MTSNNNTIIFKNKLDSGKVTNKVNIDGGDNNTIVNETYTKSKRITLDLRKSKTRGKNNKVINRFHTRNGAKIKVVLNKDPRIKISLSSRKG